MRLVVKLLKWRGKPLRIKKVPAWPLSGSWWELIVALKRACLESQGLEVQRKNTASVNFTLFKRGWNKAYIFISDDLRNMPGHPTMCSVFQPYNIWNSLNALLDTLTFTALNQAQSTVPTIMCSNSVSTLAALLKSQPTVPQFRAVFWCSSLKSQPGAVQQHAEVQGCVALECSPAFIAVEVERLLGCVVGKVPVPLPKEQNTA